MQIKQKCLRLLGSLGGSVNNILVSLLDETELGRLAVAWDKEKHLKFDVPFSDLKPTIFLGKISFANIFRFLYLD